jgi:phosphoglycolate phosphatase-like HAD superfamily hydrolase
MKLLVCDLDGTLARTVAVDEECFIQAFADVFKIRDLNTKWMEYEHVTDLGILQHVFQSRFQRKPDRDDIVRFAEYFVGLLDDGYSSDGDHFGEIPGAASLLMNLTNHSEWRVAIATGSLEASGKFKIRTARLPADNVPAAFAEDGPSREGIVRTAIERARQKYRVEHFERIVSVGDAVWDVRTARRLELPFVGLAGGQRAMILRDHGARTIIENFVNYEHCMECFEHAAIPDDLRQVTRPSRSSYEEPLRSGVDVVS